MLSPPPSLPQPRSHQSPKTIFSMIRMALFDIDETLGRFAGFGGFMRVLQEAYNSNTFSIYDHFNEILDMYPELLRPKILDIMRFLARMKRIGKCANVMIYTNNTGPISWSNHIKGYFNAKAGYPVFDKVIGAFKRPNGEVVEVRRTSHNKTYADFVSCSEMVGKFEVFFIDDREHPGMHAENVYVINVKPYTRELSMHVFIERFKTSALFKRLGLNPNAISLHRTSLRTSVAAYSDKEYEVDKLVGETILEKLHEFFDGNEGVNGVAPIVRARSLRRKKSKSSKRVFTRKKTDDG